MNKLTIAVLTLAAAGLANAGEFDGQCAYGLSLGKSVKTDCSVHKSIDGKDYCFSSPDAMASFSKDEKGNLEKAIKVAESQKTDKKDK